MTTMSEGTHDEFDTPYNVVAAFEEEMTARSAVDLLVHRGVPRMAIGVRRETDGGSEAVAEQRAEMQDELVGAWPSLGLMTRAQGKGAVGWAVALAVSGAIVGVIGGIIWGY